MIWSKSAVRPISILVNSGISFASLSAHKIGGPTGVGALLVRPGTSGEGFFMVVVREQGRRAGTENLIGIAGFGAAAADSFGDIDHFVKMATWRDAFETKLMTARRGIDIFGKEVPRLGNTSCVAAAGKTAETMVMAFDIANVAISAGSACSSGKVKPSHVLTAMNAGARAAEAIRISGVGRPSKLILKSLQMSFCTCTSKPNERAWAVRCMVLGGDQPEQR